ncbi:MAG: restriction endonuclease [Kiritimatiellia bacterium]|nr:restriction endonuclease [Kiritimatiellia bacterium]
MARKKQPELTFQEHNALSKLPKRILFREIESNIFKRDAMNRILAILFSLWITNCALANTPTNATSFNMAPDMAAVDVMPGLTFEKLAGSLLRQQGYKVGNMRASNDYGVDLIANKDKERIAVQVKRSKNKIARKAISDAVAGMKYYNCTKAMVVTNSEFTENAREFARGTECILIDRTILQQWLDSSKRAQSVAAFGATGPTNN